jgi:uncharacterized protein
VRQARTVDHTEHRPWPLPERAWTSAQSWVDLAFLHWRVDPEALEPLLPEWAELDLFDGEAWLGIVPFVLTALRVRGLVPAPVFSTFPELNVRTYVTRDGRPGVWFLSLDAGSRWFVETAKRLYRVPYRLARMSSRRDGGGVRYASARKGAVFTARYRGDGPLFRAEPGSLEEFLTERYCLYTEDRGRAQRAEIHHPPWDLQRCDVELELNTMAPVRLAGRPEHGLFSPRQDTVVWPLEAL